MQKNNAEQIYRHEFYGDEAGRFERLKALDYPTFKQELIELHNSHPNINTEDTFVATQNSNLGGTLFPRAEDKDELLQYALESAQQADDIQTAALILGVALPAIHPFYDGNGRTSRTLYGILSRGLQPESEEYKSIQINRSKKIHFEWMQYQSSDWPLIFIYNENDLKQIADLPWDASQDPEVAKYHYGEREYHGLNPDEASKLDSLLGDKYGRDGDGNIGRHANNRNAIMFGFSKLAKEEGIEFTTFDAPGEHKRSFFSVQDALAQLNGDSKRKLTTYIQDFNTIFAKKVIDLVAKHGMTSVHLQDGSTMRMRDFIVEHASTYLASKIGKAASKT